MDENPVLRLPSFKVPESNVFLMTRFRNTPYHQAISEAVTEAVHAYGLELVRADNPDIAGVTLWSKVQNCLEACHFGIAVFEDIDEADLNPNVSLELGYTMARERIFLLLKERRLQNLPTDLCGHLYKSFDSFDIRPTVLGRIAEWLKPTGVRKLDNEKLVVFVSYGGTDRCAIAKVITDHLLDQNQFPPDAYRVASRAAFSPSAASAAKTGIEVVEEKLGHNLLGKHHPRRAGVAFLFEADLILATDAQVLAKVRSAFKDYPGSDTDRGLVRDEIDRKTYLISEFFGSTGEIEDPYPDRQDAQSKRKYEKCYDALYSLISAGVPRLIEFLERDPIPNGQLRSVSFGDHRLSGTEPV